jgi:hypothetical protein
MKRVVCSVALGMLSAALVVLLSGTASAHEERVFGPFRFAVGFGEEPAYAGVENSVQLLLSDVRTGKPITNVGNTLKVQVGYGDRTMPPMLIEPNFEAGEFGTPGDYRAFFFPTRPGNYAFHFTGEIKGHRVNATFRSGPNTFSPVEDAADVEFPAKDPSSGELTEAIDRLGPRVEAASSQQKQLAAGLADQRDRADSAKALALVALVVGFVLGLGGMAIGGAGLRAARTSRRGDG